MRILSPFAEELILRGVVMLARGQSSRAIGSTFAHLYPERTFDEAEGLGNSMAHAAVILSPQPPNVHCSAEEAWIMAYVIYGTELVFGWKGDEDALEPWLRRRLAKCVPSNDANAEAIAQIAYRTIRMMIDYNAQIAVQKPFDILEGWRQSEQCHSWGEKPKESR